VYERGRGERAFRAEIRVGSSALLCIVCLGVACAAVLGASPVTSGGRGFRDPASRSEIPIAAQAVLLRAAASSPDSHEP